ncbi:uncharacterized protein SPAPADRAFT_157381 [Spathaspora passalidarum NRRL Y-27907]|uniref:Vps72/YL1 C-terminal domain-containing protein n=1 Tax=Spathaspora passalidarum (strain NRRL Y-27907 / 11-Y1) TaxID=619300 RepID=G3AU26_SPAPN|nr:uncharacterized protein SPAPADRAFT_157381 [Spathaspora passalidarum NRRL Y-27907]EGW30401.1 hypothetical protein SPAPADRAFT_157381 [Spathaspora passalidarum NRRL Y-27907]
MDEESLIATRSRRANAGSRLKQLIEQEQQGLEDTSQFITEDDDNVNLLFQVEGEDEEFIEESEEEEEEEEEEEGDDGEEGKQQEEADEEEESGSRKRRHPEEDQDQDDVFSDSDLSESDSDQSEGEKELQRQERIKKRQLKKKRAIVPEIKTVKTQSPKKKPKRTPLITSDSLLMSQRRSSSRAAAVESKHALIEKLKESEERRAKYLSRTVHKKKSRELTQQERLDEALETEKANVESLMRFREQEIVKKEKQRQLLLSKRIKLQNIIRLVSKETFIYPIEEVKQARKEYERNVRGRRKLGKKKMAQLAEEGELLVLPPFEIDQDLPLVKQEREKREEEERIRKEQEEKEREEEEKRKALEGDTEEANNGQDVSSKEEPIPSEMDVDHPVESEVVDVDVKPEQSENEIDNMEENESVSTEIKVEEGQDDIIPEPISEQVQQEEFSPDTQNKAEEEINTEKDTIHEEEPTNEDQDKEKESPKPETDETIKDEATAEIKEEKRVKFADEIELEKEETPTPTPIALHTSNNETFEGPPQRVCRNTLYFLDFNEDKRELRLNFQNLKSILFGKQSLLPASRRFKEVKTILHIGKVEPYAHVKQESDDLFESVDKLTEENPIFDELKKLPRLGIKQDVVETIEEDVEQESAEINITTEAPTGIYLPNGNKKTCMISGTEVKYFDPSTGIPYSSVETYKLLKLIEQGQIPWLSLTPETNDTGIVEIYLGSRDGSTKHAAGVPEGFDG